MTRLRPRAASRTSARMSRKVSWKTAGSSIACGEGSAAAAGRTTTASASARAPIGLISGSFRLAQPRRDQDLVQQGQALAGAVGLEELLADLHAERQHLAQPVAHPGGIVERERRREGLLA